jgi:protein-S-isoprenylcysteine O-methyltransferase Ste14
MHSTTTPNDAPAWAQLFFKVSNHLIFDVGGGRRYFQLDHLINAQKVVTLFFIFGLMHYYGNFSTAAWVYLGLHGVYGFTWLVKDLSFPNAAFSRRTTFGAMIALYGVLGPAYWSLPWLFISGQVAPSGPLLFAAVFLHTLGVAWMGAADLQKNCVMRYKKGLITDGVFAYTRNPNYLGEIMIYWSYALLVGHWIGWAVMAGQFFFLFLPRMLVKDASISRHPGFAAYEKRTGLLMPWRLLSGQALFDKRQAAIANDNGR